MAQLITSSQLLRNEPLARYTSWRVGGKADRLFVAENLADLQVFMRTLDKAEPVFFIGLGSNLLVRDGGVRGTVIVMGAGSIGQVALKTREQAHGEQAS